MNAINSLLRFIHSYICIILFSFSPSYFSFAIYVIKINRMEQQITTLRQTKVVTSSGHEVPLRMKVEDVSFSAHADFDDTSKFVTILRPPHIVNIFSGLKKEKRRNKCIARCVDSSYLSRILFMDGLIYVL